MKGKNVCRRHGGRAGVKKGTPRPHKVRHGLFKKILEEKDLETYAEALSMDEMEKLEHVSALILTRVTRFLEEHEELDESQEKALALRLGELRKLSQAIHKMETAKKPKKEEDDITKELDKG